MTTLTMTLPAELYQQLRQEAHRQGRQEHELVQLLLQEHLAQLPHAVSPQAEPGTAAALHDTILANATLPDGRLGALALADGRITAIASDAAALGPAKTTLDLGGALVLPGFIDGHVHLDKTFLSDRWHPYEPRETLAACIAIEKEQLRQAAPLVQRASALVEQAIARGTTTLRTHVDIDPDNRLTQFEGVLAVRERYQGFIDIQIVAFPQSGILAAPGTLELLDEALHQGADLVGGLDPAGFDGNAAAHLDIVFGLAERHGAGIDIHLHDGGMLGIAELEEISARTVALGMQGHVAVSHAYALGEVSVDQAAHTATQLATAGVAIMTNAPGTHSFPPVRLLRDLGVTVFAGNDNIRDSWWPFGDADMLERAMMIAYRSGLCTDADLELALDMPTYQAAKALRLPSYGLQVDAPADLVVVAARTPAEAVVTRPLRQAVFKAGRRVATDGLFVGLV